VGGEGEVRDGALIVGERGEWREINLRGEGTSKSLFGLYALLACWPNVTAPNPAITSNV
jgi:hypothetical protein